MDMKHIKWKLRGKIGGTWDEKNGNEDRPACTVMRVMLVGVAGLEIGLRSA